MRKKVSTTLSMTQKIRGSPWLIRGVAGEAAGARWVKGTMSRAQVGRGFVLQLRFGSAPEASTRWSGSAGVKGSLPCPAPAVRDGGWPVRSSKAATLTRLEDWSARSSKKPCKGMGEFPSTKETYLGCWSTAECGGGDWSDSLVRSAGATMADPGARVFKTNRGDRGVALGAGELAVRVAGGGLQRRCRVASSGQK